MRSELKAQIEQRENMLNRVIELLILIYNLIVLVRNWIRIRRFSAPDSGLIL